MIRTYRKRFVLLTMSLVTTVLLAVYAALMIYSYRNIRSELQNTMRQVLDQFGGPNAEFTEFTEFDPETRPEKDEMDFTDRPAPPDGMLPNPDRHRRDLIGNEKIATVFYDRSGGEMTIRSTSTLIDRNAVAQAAEAVSALSPGFGMLSEYRMAYCSEYRGSMMIIALTDASSLSSRMLTTGLWFLLAFFVALGVFLAISILLSRFASRPLENAIKMDREFVANISHDLKTPLTVILANNSILKQNPEATVGEQTQWIESTDGASNRMLEMIDEMLLLSSLENVGRPPVLEKTDLSSAVEKAVLQMESLAFEKEVTLEDQVAEDVYASATGRHAERIANSLIENALKYEPAGGAVTVTLETVKKRPVLTVRNEKSRIPEEDLPHVFERFYRGDKSRTESKGHGLGLPIIKAMADEIKAAVKVESGDQGTVFTVVFEGAEGLK